MADAGSSIFNKQARERLHSPEDLDKYVQVATPSAWLVVFATLLLLVGLLAWGIFGAVTTSVTSTCYLDVEYTDLHGDGEYMALCLLSPDDYAKVSVGDAAVVAGMPGTVYSVSRSAVSRDEAALITPNDYLLAALMEGDWAYTVYIQLGPEASVLEGYVPLPASITVERVAPISLVLG